MACPLVIALIVIIVRLLQRQPLWRLAKLHRRTDPTDRGECTMTYKFKSKAAGDLVMLEVDGRRLLQIIGKDADHRGRDPPSPAQAARRALHRHAPAMREGGGGIVPGV